MYSVGLWFESRNDEILARVFLYGSPEQRGLGISITVTR